MITLKDLIKLLIFLVLLFSIDAGAETLAPIVLSDAGIKQYDAKFLQHSADRARQNRRFTMDVPVRIVSDTSTEVIRATGHCQVFNQPMLDWFLIDTLKNNSQLYHSSVLPLVQRTEQFLLQNAHYPFSFVLLCRCVYQGHPLQTSLFKKGKHDESINLTSAQNASGQLVVLTRTPNVLVLFGRAATATATANTVNQAPNKTRGPERDE